MPAECIYTNGFVKARHIPRRRAGYERGVYVAAGAAEGKQTNRFPRSFEPKIHSGTEFVDPTARDGYREAWVTLFLARMSPGDKEACSRRNHRRYTANRSKSMLIRGFDHVHSTTVANGTVRSFSVYLIRPSRLRIQTYIRVRRRRRRRKEKIEARKVTGPNCLYRTLSNFRNTPIVCAIEATATLDSLWCRSYVEK